MVKALWEDEAGVILSAELVLVGTILVMGMIVGLVELQCAVVAELSDLSSSVGNISQSYTTSGIVSFKSYGGIKASTQGSAYFDRADECDCDGNMSLICNGVGEKAFLVR